MRWQMSAPFGAQALPDKHEQVEGFAPQVLVRIAQCGGPRIGMATQPPVELPVQNDVNTVPEGQAPASVIGTHCGTAPQKLVDGWTQNWSALHVASPQAERASEPASFGEETQAQPRASISHLPSIWQV